MTVLVTMFAWVQPPPPVASGTIEGQVSIRQLPRQRVANRYPGAGGGATHELMPLPVVAYLEGKIAGSSPPVREQVMAQRDTSFQPPLLIVPVGTTVRFPNDDKFFHNVFSYSKPKRFDLGRYPRGESKSVTFDEPGTVTVFCEIHKWMRAAIVVVENGHYTTVNASGAFRITGVPAGQYKLALWHPERGRKVLDVTVPATGSVRVNASF